jgi:hypothetical protein
MDPRRRDQLLWLAWASGLGIAFWSLFLLAFAGPVLFIAWSVLYLPFFLLTARILNPNEPGPYRLRVKPTVSVWLFVLLLVSSPWLHLTVPLLGDTVAFDAIFFWAGPIVQLLVCADVLRLLMWRSKHRPSPPVAA